MVPEPAELPAPAQTGRRSSGTRPNHALWIVSDSSKTAGPIIFPCSSNQTKECPASASDDSALVSPKTSPNALPDATCDSLGVKMQLHDVTQVHEWRTLSSVRADRAAGKCAFSVNVERGENVDGGSRDEVG